MTYPFIVFDFDGTLLDPLEGFTKSVAYTTDHFGLEAIPPDVMKTLIGPPIRQSFQEYYHIGDALAEEMTEVFRTKYKSGDIYDSVLYAGVREMLAGLHGAGAKLALATYKRQDYTSLLMKHFKIAPFFAHIYGSNETRRTKLEIVRHCVREMKPPSLAQAVFVGDTVSDKESAQKTGVDFIGVTYGYGFAAGKTKKEDGFAALADDVEALYRLLK